MVIHQVCVKKFLGTAVV